MTVPVRNITTIVVLFNPELGDKEIYSFPKGISLKMNVTVWLEFELVYYNVTD